ncbi:hypothetical protein [Dendronalium sp. ChiSLP03b]|uniref:hypothetical protein n=1 Tax=Dendronalium sp. ChiSLP03b TaxID=3075381 RepID=UPI002AD26A1B|nr:hypothetical protein [Dendronalium sp. ChiSLP03b]MDZ8207213.1 hypothetical protein [Dendronalium sp. ChiSLP03b]
MVSTLYIEEETSEICSRRYFVSLLRRASYRMVEPKCKIPLTGAGEDEIMFVRTS